MRQDKQKIISKGIQATRPYQWWAIDLVDMNFYKNIKANRNYRYIFSCLDIFSKFCWFFPLKNKEVDDTTEAFKKILRYNLRFNKNGKGDYKFPAYVVSDLGTEYKGEFKNYLK